MALAVVRDNHLTFEGIKYFRGGAEEIELGSFGEKRTPLFGTNYLEVFRNLPFHKLKVQQPTEVTIDFSQSNEADVTANFKGKVLGVSGNLSVGSTYAKLQQGHLKLIKFSVDRGDMIEAANTSSRELTDLINLGNAARIAHQIFVVMEATLAKTVTTTVSFDVSVNAGDLQLTPKGNIGTSSTTTVTLVEGSTFAYLLLEPGWDFVRQQKRTKIVNARDDQWSLN